MYERERLDKKYSRERIWEIDALRGMLILGVLMFHLYYTVGAYCINGIYNIDSYAYVNATDPLHFWFEWGEDGVIYSAFLTSKLRSAWIQSGVDCFFVLSGISCIFTRNSGKRMARLLAAGYLWTLFTFGLYLWTGNLSEFSRFGPLLCNAYCNVCYFLLLEKKENKTLVKIILVSFGIGYFLKFHPIYLNTAVLLPFGIRPFGQGVGEYAPMFPQIGWLLIGVIKGRTIYAKKISLWPKSRLNRLTRPLQWLGRHSGAIYLTHIVVYTAVFHGIGYVFDLL